MGLPDLTEWYKEQQKQAQQMLGDTQSGSGYLDNGRLKLGVGCIGLTYAGFMLFRGGQAAKKFGAWWHVTPLTKIAIGTGKFMSLMVSMNR